MWPTAPQSRLIMPSHSVEIYSSTADQAATEAMLLSVMGVACPTVSQGGGRYISLRMSDAQLVSFKASVGSIASAKWYQFSYEEVFSRILMDTNVATALPYVDDGIKWDWGNNQQANAGTTLTLRRDVIYAAPDGLSTNTGSISSPLDARSAFLQSPVAAPIIYLREGTHDITADTDITAAVEIRNYAGEDVFIRLVSPSAPTVRQLAISNAGAFFESNRNGGILRIGSEPSDRLRSERYDYPNMGRVDMLGPAHPDGAFRGVYFHDLLTFTSQGYEGGKPLKDCVMWNFGYHWSEGVDGEFMYLQNSGESEKSIENVLLAQNFGNATQIYGSGGGGEIKDIALSRFIVLTQRQVWGSSASPIRSLKLEDSLLLHGSILFGAGSVDNTDVYIRNNYIVSRSSYTAIGKWLGGEFRYNTLVALSTHLFYCHIDSTDVLYDDNVYYNPNNEEISNGSGKTFAEWQLEGRDPNSSHFVANPPENYIQLNPCESGKMLAFIGVSNIQELPTVEVDVSSLDIEAGQLCRLRQGYDPLNDVTEFEYDGSGTIQVNFVGRSIAIPIGDSVAIETLSLTKGAWVLEAV
jgi:hypothetical protein